MPQFRYRQEKIGILGKNARPIADVYLKTDRGEWIIFNPYIDSGADLTLLPLSTGNLIGLKKGKSKPQNLGGISGGIPVIFTRVIMKIGDHEFEARVAWAQIRGVPPLLGRADVFDNFSVTFKQSEGVIEFIRNP